MFVVQKWPFFELFFLGNIGQKNVFHDILERNNAFLGYKNKKFKQSKIIIFLKGLTHGFGLKMAIFPIFFYAIYSRKMSVKIFQNEKTPFQAIKTTSSKRRKIDIFLKGLTHSFGPKMPLFQLSFFRQYRPGIGLLCYSRTRKRLSKLSKQEVEKVEKLTFFQRG